MIAGLFLLLALALFMLLIGWRKSVISLTLTTLVLALAVFYHLATDILHINW